MPVPPRSRAAAAGALLVLCAGCSTTSHGSTTPVAPPTTGPVQTITKAGQIALPTDAYIITPAEVKLIVKAQDVVRGQCMRKLGFTPKPSVLLGVDEAATARKTRSFLYGYFDTAKAGAEGYERVQSGDIPQQASISSAEQTALTGVDPVTHKPATRLGGKPLPARGCSGKAIDTLNNAGLWFDDASLPAGGPRIPRSDPRLAAAYASWSACMKGKGFDYPDPLAAIGDPKWVTHRSPGTPPTRAEIATARADIACKLAKNTVGKLVTVQIAYDKQYLKADAAQLASHKRRIDDLVRKASRITHSRKSRPAGS